MKGKQSRLKPPADVRLREHTPNRLAQIRHDLRTPVVHVLGYSELLQEITEERGLHQFVPDLKRIQIAGKNLVNLINELLSPARVEAKDIDLRHVHSELRTPLNHITGYCEIVQELAEETKQTDLLPDLQKIHLASRKFLTLVETLLVPANFSERGAPKPAPHFEREQVAPLPRRTRGAVPRKRGAILVVDDDEGNRDVLNRRLRRQGHKVTTAESGPQGLQLLRKCKFDLVLLDLLMPEMDGMEVLRQVKADPDLQNIPVLMLSALDELDAVVRCIKLGAEDHLPKPFPAAILHARVESCLANKRMSDQLRKYTEWLFGKSLFSLAVAGPGSLALRRQERTVLFADIRGFTHWSERHTPEDAFAMLNRYFEDAERIWATSPVIKTEYTGDEIMAVFPAAPDAVRIAHSLRVELGHLLRGFGLGIGLGLHTGPVSEGLMGGVEVKAYCFVGDTVNSASRICKQAQAGQVLLSEATCLQAGSFVKTGPSFEVSAKGKAEPLKVRPLLTCAPD